MVSTRVIEKIRARTLRFLTETCQIEEEQEIIDIYGARTHTWQVVANVACRVITVGSRFNTGTRDVGTQESMVDEYRLVCPYDTALGVDQRVTVGDVTYQITRVLTDRTDATDAQAIMVRVRDG